MNGAISKDERTVHVGANSQVSMQVLQDIYNDITGKTEKLSQTYTDSHFIEMEDLLQLNSKIRQMYEQFHIVSENCNVTVYHSNDAKERFSSFERFKIYDGSSLNPVESVSLEYDFLIVLPRLDRPQPYKINITLNSRVGLMQRAKKEGGVADGFFHYMASRTAVVEIDYIDYAVARNFKSAIDQWMSSLKVKDTRWLMNKFKSVSEYFSHIFRNSTVLFVAASFCMGATGWFEKSQQSFSSLFLISVVAFSSIYVASNIAAKLGSLTERWVDTSLGLSYVKLNRGDENAIKEFNGGERVRFLKIGISIGLAIGVNIFSNWVSKLFGI
jgi:hypothetical protein